MKPVLVFDYDGTIHNTILIYEPAFRAAYGWLVEQGYTQEQELSTKTISAWLGMNSKEMWNSFLPQLPEKVKEEVSCQVGERMVEEILFQRAHWYPKMREILNELKAKGYAMLILSNCKIAYRQVNWNEFNMGQWFRGFYDCETYGFAPKTEIIQKIKATYQEPFLVIGDRESDLAAARACNAAFVGCSYGFGAAGELDGADALIASPEEMLQQIQTF